MNVLIVYAHPEPTSFCGAMKDAAVEALTEAGHDVVVSDLHAMGFDPAAGRHDFVAAADASRFHYQTEQLHAAKTGGFAPDLAREQERFHKADLVVFIFPLWWGGAPAILKGWIDRALACGFAYVDGARFTKGLFKEKRGLLCLSTGGTPERFREEDVYGPIEKVLWPLQHLTFEYMGMQALDPFVAYASPRVSAEERAEYLAAWRKRVVAATA